jgi:ABC-2 type transport system ATP-binding protein
MNAVIEVEGLRKQYRGRRGARVAAVDGLDLSVPAGGVFGFLGPNGAGKTTTIRCLLGLVRPTAGTCRLLGADVHWDLPTVIDQVGSLVETPGIAAGMSGRESLLVLASLGGLPRRRVDAVIDEVGMGDRIDRAVRGYSLGMRQRLGLAMALLREPEVLILDEPANGLDPAGIRDIRHLIRRLGDEGRTVFLSSHLLAEVEQVCDRVAIVSRGRTVSTGRIDEVLADARPRAVWVTVDEPDDGTVLLRRAGFEVTREDQRLVVAIDPAEAAVVSKVLAGGGVYPRELRAVERNLEAAFLALTEPDEPHQHPDPQEDAA